MKAIGAILVMVLVVSMFVVFTCAPLALIGGEPPVALGTVSAGTALLAAGLLSFGEAIRKSGSPASWRGSGVKVGWLSSFAFGIGCCAMGVVFLGYGFLPERYLIRIAIVILAAIALGLLGMGIDRRAYEREVRRNSQAAAPPGTGTGKARIAESVGIVPRPWCLWQEHRIRSAATGEYTGRGKGDSVAL